MTDLIALMGRAAQLKTGTPDWTWAGVAQEVLKAAEEAGFVLVPKEPTEEMSAAGFWEAGERKSQRFLSPTHS